ncbi:MAG TPA: hypothetical protein VHM20_04195 [Gammaproteobacteria bacterium]|jgi:hypothetical protein|nr:hypothetical protein [Gammaproteobacteria bacterium]
MLRLFARLLPTRAIDQTNINTPLLNQDSLHPIYSLPEEKKYFPFDALYKDLLHEIFYFLEPRDLAKFKLNRAWQKTVYDFFEMNKFEKINKINEYRQYSRTVYQKRKRFYQFLLFALTFGTGVCAYLTGRIFTNNRPPLQSIQDQYHAPSDDPFNTLSCQQKLDILYQNSQVVPDDDDGYEATPLDEDRIADNGMAIHKCELDTTSIRCYVICNNGLIDEEDPDCQALHLSMQKQRCYPARTMPPYIGGITLMSFLMVLCSYYNLPPFSYPQYFEQLLTHDESIKEFILTIPDTQFTKNNFFRQNINAAIRAIVQFEGGLFSRSRNKDFRKFIEYDANDNLTSIRIDR